MYWLGQQVSFVNIILAFTGVGKMVFLIELVSVLFFIAFVGSQVVWPWVDRQPLFPSFRPSVRRLKHQQDALEDARRELERLRGHDN